jgi:hypothetical protein
LFTPRSTPRLCSAAFFFVAQTKRSLGDVSAAAASGDADGLYAALLSEHLGITDTDEMNKADYLGGVAALVDAGTSLTVGTLQDAVDDANATAAARRAEEERIAAEKKAEEERLASTAYAIEQINAAIDAADPDAVVVTLSAPAAGIDRVDPDCGLEYFVKLRCVQ